MKRVPNQKDLSNWIPVVEGNFDPNEKLTYYVQGQGCEHTFAELERVRLRSGNMYIRTKCTKCGILEFKITKGSGSSNGRAED